METFRPGKQRTRQHVIADLSVHHLEGFILAEGHTAQRLGSDYGYDMVMFTYDDQGYIEPDSVLFQLKAAQALQVVGTDYVFDLDIRDYHLWQLERMPVILILYEAERARAYWLHIQGYFSEDKERLPARGAKTIRVRIPQGQPVNRRAVKAMRRLKWLTRRRATGGA